MRPSYSSDARSGWRMECDLSEYIDPGASVVMAVFNGMRHLPEQLGSVLSQLEADDEVIVIDDCSTDGSYEWVCQVNDCRIRSFRHEQNLGVRRSFELGLSLAKNEVIFLCDQDDLWLPNKRRTFCDVFTRNPSVSVVISDVRLMSETGEVFEESFMRRRGGFHPGVFANIYKNRYLGCAMAVRKSTLSTILPIPPSVPMHDMWIGIVGSMLGAVVYFEVPHMHYRRHAHNVSSLNRSTIGQVAKWRVQLLLALAGRLRRIVASIMSV